MKKISNDTIIDDLRRRLNRNDKALQDLLVMTRKFEVLNEKLRQAESHKSNFLSNVRHELNNPLAVIMNLSSELQKDVADAETVVRAARTIYNEAFELDFQLRNILFAAEIEAGESTISVTRVDIVQLISGLVEVFQQKISAKNLNASFAFETASREGTLDFYSDNSKLSCILANLLDNAIKFNHEGEEIYILAEKSGERLRVSVSDNGVGIAEKDQKTVFERFVRIGITTNKRAGGHGLGLSVSQALAEMLDGSVTFSSPSGKGCIFTLSVREAKHRGRKVALSENTEENMFDDAHKY